MEVNASLINFAAGQLSKKFLARIDLPNFYKAGTLLCRNYVPQVQGPAEFRIGSRYVLHTRLNGITSLYPFVFNDSQAYALAFSDKKLRFFSDGGVVLGSAGSTQSQLLTHFDGVDGVQAYTAETGQTLTFVADAQLDTAIKKFGTASLLLDGTGDYVTVPDSTNWAFGTGAFTIEAQVYLSATGAKQGILSQGQSGENFYVLYLESDDTWLFKLVHNNVYVVSLQSTTTAAGTTWYHVAVVRSGDTWSLYIDGVLEDSATYAGEVRDLVGPFVIGARNIGSIDQFFTGNIDEVRVTKGTAIWTGAFTPPTVAYSTSNIIDITGITQANPGVITAAGHGYTGGEEIIITDVEGMTELNGNYYLVVYINADTFSLTDIDATAINTTAYTAYTTGGSLDSIYEIATPYLAADVFGLQVAQKADLMYIVHPDYAPRKITRSGDASWAITTYTRTDDPFAKTVSGITQASPGVVTATGHGFSDGNIIQLEDVVGMVEVNENKYKVSNKAANTFELTDSVTGASIDTSGFTAYSSAGVVFVAENMPGAVAFYGGRLFFGGTDNDPETFWGSKAPDNEGTVNYDVFTVGASAEDAVTFPISSQNNMADRIQWFAGVSKFLAIGTYGGVYKANGGSDSTPISGTAIAVKAVEFVGCKSLAPVRVGSALYYVQRGGLILNSFAWTLLADDFKSKSLNVFSDEITKTGLKQLAIQQGTADIVWSVTTEGKLLGMTVNEGEEITAWHSHDIGGTDVVVLSVCGEPQPSNRDDLWMVVERTINSVTRRYMEYFTADDVLPEPEDTYTGVRATDDTVYRSLLFEQAKTLVRVDSALTLDTTREVALTPGAVTGTGITFTADNPVFAATDVGRIIKKKYVTGSETGAATITAYTSSTIVTATITTDFDSVTQIATENWFLTSTSVTGLDHLEGEVVHAQIDGYDDGTEYTVTSGAITLGSAATIAHMGPLYKGRLVTMPLDIGALAGTAQGRVTTVNRLGLLFRHARGTKYGTDLYRLDTVIERDTGEVAGRPPMLITKTEFLNVPDGYDRRKFVYIVQDTANPSTIQGIVPFVDTTNE